MNIIIPMAGMGKRLRPHTLTVPKPLLAIGGKSIVHHLVEDIAGLVDEQVDEIVFVTGRFGEETEKMLLNVAEDLGAHGKIAYQDEALGTAHAIWCAKEALKGKVIVAFADTLFTADFELDEEADGVLWVKQIDDPSSFGVVRLNDEDQIIDFVEKPQTYVSDLAMIGIYYFKHGEELAEEIRYLIENDVTKGGEFQLPDALKRLTEKGKRFVPGKVDEWMDCGNPRVTTETAVRLLELKYKGSQIPESAKIENSVIIDPCFIGDNVRIVNSVVGPGVSVGKGTVIENCRIEKSLIQNENELKGVYLSQSMIGSHVRLNRKAEEVSLGDYNVVS